MLLFDVINKLFVKFPSISVNELASRRHQGQILLIDVRSRQEFDRNHIKGARNIPLETLNNFHGDKNQPIYVICQSGMRSRMAARQLAKRGYQPINIIGGMSAWNFLK